MGTGGTNHKAEEHCDFEILKMCIYHHDHLISFLCLVALCDHLTTSKAHAFGHGDTPLTYGHSNEFEGTKSIDVFHPSISDYLV